MGSLYFSPLLPSTGEVSDYNRVNDSCLWFSAHSFTWIWSFYSGTKPTPLPGPIRLVIDGGAYYSDYQPAPTSGIAYTFHVPDPVAYPAGLPNGHHCITGVEGLTTGYEPVLKPFLVNSTGAMLPLADQKPYYAPMRNEMEYGGFANGWTQFDLSGGITEPTRKPLKARVIAPYTTRLPYSQLWTQRLNESHRIMWYPRVYTYPTGDYVIAAQEKYFYNHATSQGTLLVGQVPPMEQVADGPRGIGTFGYMYKPWLRFDNAVMYFCETNGRLGMQIRRGGFKALPGQDMSDSPMVGTETEIVTVAGWRRKKTAVGAGVHPGVLGTSYSTAHPSTVAADQALFYEQYEHVGDWSKIPNPPGLPNNPYRTFEPWGYAVANLDLLTDQVRARHGLEFWWCDTLNHRILFVNAWPMHKPLARPALFPPVGYTSPSNPDGTPKYTGQSDIVHFMGATNQTRTALCSDPYDIIVHPTQKKLYWTNYASGSICRCDLDGSNAEVFIQDPSPLDAYGYAPSQSDVMGPEKNAQGQWNGWYDPVAHDYLRFHPGILMGTGDAGLASLRAAHLVDGPPGVASCCRPQTLVVDSQNNLVWSERYTYAVRKYDFATGQVSTIVQLPRASMQFGYGSSYTQDLGIAVDDQGSIGPVDDILIFGWHNTTYRYDKNGAYASPVGGFLYNGSQPFQTGRTDYTDRPNYGWAIDCHNGEIVMFGNDGGSQGVSITKLQPTDPQWTTARHESAARASMEMLMCPMTEDGASGNIRYGPFGQNWIPGAQNIEDLGALTDEQLQALSAPFMRSTYFSARFTGATSANFVDFVRLMTADLDYSGTTPSDPGAAVAPTEDLTLSLLADLNGYKRVCFEGVAPNDPLLKQVRVFCNGKYVSGTCTVVAGQPFRGAFLWPNAEQVTISHAFDTGSAELFNERSQTYNIGGAQGGTFRVLGTQTMTQYLNAVRATLPEGLTAANLRMRPADSFKTDSGGFCIWRDKLAIAVGGGHNDSYDDGAYALDLTSEEWETLLLPSTTGNVNARSDTYGEWIANRPASQHGYNHLVTVGDDIVQGYGFAVSWESVANKQAHRLLGATSTWERYGSGGTQVLHAHTVIYDTVRERILRFPNSQVNTVDTISATDKTAAWTVISMPYFPPIGQYAAVGWHQQLDVFVLVDNKEAGTQGKLWVMDPNNMTAGWTQVTVNQTAGPALGTSTTCLEYIPPYKRFAVGVTGANAVMYYLSPDASNTTGFGGWSWSSEPYVAEDGVSVPSNWEANAGVPCGVWGCMKWSTLLSALVLWKGASSLVEVFTPSAVVQQPAAFAGPWRYPYLAAQQEAIQ